MRKLVARAANVIFEPEREWAVIARENRPWSEAWLRFFAPLALLAPLANGARVLIGGDGAVRVVRDSHAAREFALISLFSGFLASMLSVLALAAVTWLLAPLFAGRRSFHEACRVVIYAGTPLWLAGAILIAPLNRFPLLAIVILIAIIHSTFLFYLGIHHLLNVPRRDAAESTAIIMVAGVLFSTVVGYYASAAGLFPHL